MSEEKVSAKLTGGDTMEVTYDFGKKLDDAVKICSVNGQDGKAIVRDLAVAGMRSMVQNLVRNGIKAGRKQEEVQAEIDSWAPGVKHIRQTPVEKMLKAFNGLNAAEKKAMLTSLGGQA